MKNILDFTTFDDITIARHRERYLQSIEDAKLDRDYYLTNKLEISKDIVHDEFIKRWIENNYWGAGYLATGTGKSRIGVLCSQFSVLLSESPSPKVLLVVPTEMLRDDNWKEEFELWDREDDIWNKNLTRTCYASLNKIEDQEWDLVILDEGHHLTENNFTFFRKNKVDKLLVLTATPPQDAEKINLLVQLRLRCLLHYSLQEAELDGLVSKFNIYLVETQLDAYTKNIKAGSKKCYWLQTEKEKYDYLSEIITKLYEEKSELITEFDGILDGKMLYKMKKKLPIPLPPPEHLLPKYKDFLKREKSLNGRIDAAIRDRQHFLYNLPSKTELAKKVLEKFSKGGKYRTLLFGGSKLQVEEICGKDNVFHSSSNTDKEIREERTAYHEFKTFKKNILGVIKSVNEGHSIPLLDVGIVVQINSKELDIIQRIGRIIRYRENFVGRIVIIVCTDTVDLNWYDSAMKSLKRKKIKVFDASFFEK